MTWRPVRGNGCARYLGVMKVRILSILALFVAGACVLAACGGSSSDQEAATPTTAVTSTATVPDPAPQPVDTGRMSQGEWESARRSIFDVNGEIKDFRDKLSGRCSALFTAGDIAAALECTDDAYDGIEGAFLLAGDELRGLQDDTGKRCRRSLRIAARLVDGPLYQSVLGTKDSFNTLDSATVLAAVRRMNSQQSRWGNASGNVLQLCAPS